MENRIATSVGIDQASGALAVMCANLGDGIELIPPFQSEINALQDRHFRLLTLGRLALIDPHGNADESLGKRKRKLAILARLALSRDPITRDALAEMFWGDQEESRAKHSLSDALWHLRRVIGPDSITTRQTDIELSDGAPLDVDAIELATAASRQNWERVLDLYGGAFLDGLYVAESLSFEHWVTRERERLRQLFLTACAKQCATLVKNGKCEENAAVAARWLDADPLSADAALALLHARKAIGTLESLRQALSDYRQLTERLSREHDVEPDTRVSALAATIANEEESLARARGEEQWRASPATVDVAAPVASARRSLWPIVAAAVFVLVVGRLALSARKAPAASARPAIAVVDIQSLRSDSSDLWLEQGLPQMIAADLSRVAHIDVVPPEHVRQVRLRTSAQPEHALSLPDMLRIGRGVGATAVVSGGLTHGNGVYVLDVSVHDVHTGEVRNLFTVSNSNVFVLADEAAARLAGSTNATEDGPQFANIETPSIDAYQHYVHARQEFDIGRSQEGTRELDAAIALDSGFVGALVDRLSLASSAGDYPLVKRLLAQLEKNPTRGTDFDRMAASIIRARFTGEYSRALVLARELEKKFPREPLAYQTLADVLMQQARFAEADSVYQRLLALDSLGMESGSGPCVPCTAYGGDGQLKLFLGDFAGAERAARRWLTLQPEAATPWALLSDIFSYQQRWPEAYQARTRSMTLADDPDEHEILVRMFLEARRYQAVDSALAVWRARKNVDPGDIEDVQTMLERERGQFRASAQLLHSERKDEALRFIAANSLARTGDYASAIRVHEDMAHSPPNAEVLPGVTPLAIRRSSWLHALEADAIAPSGDTARLRAIADTLELTSSRSWYARDWRLHHHVRGLIAMQANRYEEAIREFQQARWGIAGWTRTVEEIAKAQLALRRPAEAIATLRDAYKGPLDSMGRYAPRSELDFWMAIAQAQAGARDSARVYAAYVRSAWRNADPNVQRLLAQLPR